MLPPELFLHLRRIGMASLGDGLVLQILRVVGLGKEEPALGQQTRILQGEGRVRQAWNILQLEQAISASRYRLFESGTSLMVPVQLILPEAHGFNATEPSHGTSYFSTPAALAVCVAIASINGGDKQS